MSEDLSMIFLSFSHWICLDAHSRMYTVRSICICIYTHTHTGGRQCFSSSWVEFEFPLPLVTCVCVGTDASDLSALILISSDDADLLRRHGLTVKDNSLVVAVDYLSSRSALVFVVAAELVDFDNPECRRMVHWGTEVAYELTDRDERLERQSNQPAESHTCRISRMVVAIWCRTRTSNLSWCHTESQCSTLGGAGVVMMETTLIRDWLFVYLFGVSG